MFFLTITSTLFALLHWCPSVTANPPQKMMQHVCLFHLLKGGKTKSGDETRKRRICCLFLSLHVLLMNESTFDCAAEPTETLKYREESVQCVHVLCTCYWLLLHIHRSQHPNILGPQCHDGLSASRHLRHSSNAHIYFTSVCG